MKYQTIKRNQIKIGMEVICMRAPKAGKFEDENLEEGKSYIVREFDLDMSRDGYNKWNQDNFIKLNSKWGWFPLKFFATPKINIPKSKKRVYKSLNFNTIIDGYIEYIKRPDDWIQTSNFKRVYNIRFGKIYKDTLHYMSCKSTTKPLSKSHPNGYTLGVFFGKDNIFSFNLPDQAAQFRFWLENNKFIRATEEEYLREEPYKKKIDEIKSMMRSRKSEPINDNGKIKL